MITKIKKLFVLLLLLQIFWPARLFLADTRSKPTMNLVTGDLVTIISGVYECERPECSDALILNLSMNLASFALGWFLPV